MGEKSQSEMIHATERCATEVVEMFFSSAQLGLSFARTMLNLTFYVFHFPAAQEWDDGRRKVVKIQINFARECRWGREWYFYFQSEGWFMFIMLMLL